MTTPSARPNLVRRALAISGAAVAAAALIVAATTLPGSTSSTNDSMLNPAPSASSTSSQTGVGIYDHGTYSVQLTITNTTGQTMTFLDDPAKSTVGGGHWATRPVTLGKGDSMITTAYSDQPDGFSWQVVYQLDNGEYATVNLNSAELTNEKPHNISVGIGTGWEDGGWINPDTNWTADLTNSSGSHSWVTVNFKPFTG